MTSDGHKSVKNMDTCVVYGEAWWNALPISENINTAFIEKDGTIYQILRYSAPLHACSCFRIV